MRYKGIRIYKSQRIDKVLLTYFEKLNPLCKTEGALMSNALSDN